MRLETRNIRIHGELGEICLDEYLYEFHFMGLVKGSYGCNYSVA